MSPVKKSRWVTLARKYWDDALAAVILLVLALFLLGVNFGLNSFISIILATIGGLILPIILFFTAGLIAPILAFLVGSIAVPISAFFTGIFTNLLGWLAGTWLGSLISPLISAISPLLPWISATRTAQWVWKTFGPLYQRHLNPHILHKPKFKRWFTIKRKF